MAAILGIGTASFVPGYGLGAAADRPTPELLRRAIEAGVTYVDTASVYGDAENAVGGIAALVAERSVRLCTKIGLDPADVDLIAVRDAARRSAARLRVPCIDTILLHNAATPAFRSPAIGRVFAALVDERLARRVGASTYGAEAARTALASMWCSAVQVEFSLLNQSVIRALGDSARPDQELIARSVLCKGLLTRRRGVAWELAHPAAATIEALDERARAWGFDLPELAIRFALDTSHVDVVLVGIASTEELDVALAAASRAPLSVEQYRELEAFDRSSLDCVHPERWHTLA